MKLLSILIFPKNPIKCLCFVYVLFFSLLFSQSGLIPEGLKRQAIQNGLSEDQIKKIVKDSGFEIENNFGKNSNDESKTNNIKNSALRQQEIQTIIDDSNPENSSINDVMRNDDINNNLDPDDDFEKEGEENDLDDQEEELADSNTESAIPTEGLKYFGYNIFQNNPELFQNSQNLNVDPNYILGPGDEVILMLWGETEINKSYIVSSEGYLFIDNVGQIFVNGLTMSRLEDKLYKLLKKVYSSIGSPNQSNAKTFFDLSLGGLAIRPMRIFVLGEVNKPGAYSMNPSTTLFSSLFYFNGPTEKGSLRNIQLIRKGEIVKNIDFYDYLLDGKKLDDAQLQRDDIIFISQRGKTVSVIGEINRPAIFELKAKEGLKDLMKIFGGLKSTSYTKRALLSRIVPYEQRASLMMSRKVLDIKFDDLLKNGELKNDLQLFDGDELEIFKISDQVENSLSLVGAVKRPGIYQVFQGMRIMDLFEISDGLLADAFLHKIDILRSSSYSNGEQLVINFLKAEENDLEHNIVLKPNDIITVYSLEDMLEQGTVTIEGHVFNPGPKPYYNGMTINDLVFIGGGFKNKNHLKQAFLPRADLYRFDDKSSSSKLISFRLDSLLENVERNNFNLFSNDRVVIYSKKDITGDSLKTVVIEGQVKNPGRYELTDGMTLNELFFMACGFNDKVFFKTVLKNRFDIIRKDKDDKRKNIFSYNLNEVLANKLPKEETILQSDDLIRIYAESLVDFSNTVDIEGEIVLPGKYNLKKGMTLGDLILEAGGISEELYDFRAEISRIESKNKNTELYAFLKTFDFENSIKIFEDKLNPKNKLNLTLQSDDLVIIRPGPFYSRQEKVTISGLVYYPGDYVISNSNEKVSDIILRAGGLRPEGYAKASTLERNGTLINLDFDKILKNPKSSFNFSVVSGDLLEIKGKPNLIVVQGEVYNPGNYQFLKGKRLNDYISMSGGLTRDASKYSSFITYPNGHTRKIKLLNLSPKVIDGSIITVGRKEDVVPFNVTEYVSTLTNIYSELMQVYLLITLSARD